MRKRLNLKTAFAGKVNVSCLAGVSKLTLCETVQNREFRRIEAHGLADHGFYEVRPCVSGDRNSKPPIGAARLEPAKTSIFHAANAFGST
jgi:hypothetical protein